jgi:PD-(D/E)XK nuclease superfamily
MATKKKAYEKGDIVRFSNSTLGTFEDCPRCFWLEQRHGIKHPRGPFPSLPGGVDRVLKDYFDKHMSAGTLPPEMAELEGASPFGNRHQMNEWRNWRNLIIDIPDENGEVIAQLSGALDELIVWPDGLHSPYDYKTRGAPPVEGASEDYYGTQLDIYHLLVERGCDLKCNGDGYLGYYWPQDVTGHGDFKFTTGLVKLETNPDRAIKLVRDAVKCMESDELPDVSMALDKKGNTVVSCEFCDYALKYEKVVAL